MIVSFLPTSLAHSLQCFGGYDFFFRRFLVCSFETFHRSSRHYETAVEAKKKSENSVGCDLGGAAVGVGMRQDGISPVPAPERAGQESYLDPVYIFQGSERGKMEKFLVFNYRAAVAKGTLSVVVLRQTA